MVEAVQMLTTHFARHEFELDGPMPEVCVTTYTILCQEILEPVRNNWSSDKAIITSGYRSAAVNSADHGVANSEHIATKDWCAADFYVESFHDNMREVFTWIRLGNSPFHQVILEHGSAGDIVHVSWNRFARARQAFEGSTFNREPYVAWPVGSASDSEIDV